MISQMLLGSTQSESVDVDEDVIQSAFSQASGTLDMWDSYVNALGSSGQNGSLREAYSLLQGIDGQVSALKNSTASVPHSRPDRKTAVKSGFHGGFCL